VGERIRRAGAVAWALIGLAGLLVLLGVVAWWLRVIWPPLIIAGAIVFLLNPVVTALHARHVPRVAGAALAYLAVGAVMAAVLVLVVPLGARQAGDLSDELPDVRARAERWLDGVAEDTADWIIPIPSSQELQDEFAGGGEPLAERVDQVRDVGLAAFHVLLVVVIAPILAFYLLVDLPRLHRIAESLVPRGSSYEVQVVARRLNRAIGGFFRGQLLVALLVGALVSVGLFAIDLPFWLIVGMVAGLFNVIPLIGPWVGAVPGVVLALTTGDLRQALLVGAVMAVAQQIDNHFISPLVMRRAVRLHPAAVMLALLAGGTIGGFFGLLIAVPTAAVLKIVGGHMWRTYVLGQPIEEIEREWHADDAEPGVGFVEDLGGRR
jgi:predicted PurR-regulated permease PerM